MSSPKRILILGAETELGAETARSLAEAGHTLALIASSSDAELAFSVQRLARKLNASTSQAIDATNDAAVRVMVRQVVKLLGGLNAAVICVENKRVRSLVERYAGREMARSGEPLVVNMARDTDVHLALAGEPRTR